MREKNKENSIVDTKQYKLLKILTIAFDKIK